MADGGGGAKERDVADARFAGGAASGRLKDNLATGRHCAAKFGFRAGAGPGWREGEISADGGGGIRAAQRLVVRHRGGPGWPEIAAGGRWWGPGHRSLPPD